MPGQAGRFGVRNEGRSRGAKGRKQPFADWAAGCLARVSVRTAEDVMERKSGRREMVGDLC